MLDKNAESCGGVKDTQNDAVKNFIKDQITISGSFALLETLPSWKSFHQLK